MITPKIEALFQFIGYLYSNIENFSQYNDLIQELELLNIKRQELSPENNYKDKLKYDELQAELKSKFKVLQDNTATLIKDKATKLNLCKFENEHSCNWNEIKGEIDLLIKDFNKADVLKIFNTKRQYIEYRTKTHKTFLSLEFFFDELDKIAKSLFDFFKDSELNEFETFETKSIEVNNLKEAIEQLKKGNKKVYLPNDFLNTNIGVGKIDNTLSYENVKVNFIDIYNKEVTPERKEQLKTQLENYRTVQEKISFLKQEKFNYLQSITPETFEASGSVFFPNFEKGQPLFFDRYIQIEIDRLEQSLLPQYIETKTDSQKRKPSIKAPIIAFFCQLVNESKFISKGETETVQAYCSRICNLFNLTYTDRVRQGFSKNKNLANSIKVKELILPHIDIKASKAITEYLDSKHPPRQNLYA